MSIMINRNKEKSKSYKRRVTTEDSPLIRLCKENRLTMKELGERLCITAPTLRNLLNNQGNFSVLSIIMLAQILKKEPLDVFAVILKDQKFL